MVLLKTLQTTLFINYKSENQNILSWSTFKKNCFILVAAADVEEMLPESTSRQANL